MNKLKKNIPQISFLLITSLLCMTYIVEDVVKFQIGLFIFLIVCYFIAPKNKIMPQYRRLYVMMLFFSLLYIFRAFVDLELLEVKQTLFGSNSTVYVFLFIGAFLQLYIVPRLKLDEKSFSWCFFAFSLMVLASLFISFRNIMSGDVVMTGDGRIQADERLGVIQYGHLGLTAVIMGIVMLLKRKESLLFLIISPLLLLIGLLSILMAGTRSAMVGLFIIIIFFSVTRMKTKSIIFFAIVFGVLVLLSPTILSFSDSLGSNSAARMLSFLTEGGDQSSGRTGIWLYALGKLLASPLVGVSCFISANEFGNYFLHNSFIEVAYAMGFVGLIPFLIIHAFALKTSYKIFKQNNIDYLCFSMLYIQYFVYTLFSESIVRLPEYWYFLAMVICIGFNYLPVNKKTI